MARSLGAFVLETPDPRRLAAFYSELLGWETVGDDDGDDFVRLRAPERERPGLSFQRAPEHVAPTWPSRRGQQQMQAHVDVLVDDLAAEVARAESLGARRDPHQPQADGVVVLRDPDGHPVCLFLEGY